MGNACVSEANTDTQTEPSPTSQPVVEHPNLHVTNGTGTSSILGHVGGSQLVPSIDIPVETTHKPTAREKIIIQLDGDSARTPNTNINDEPSDDPLRTVTAASSTPIPHSHTATHSKYEEGEGRGWERETDSQSETSQCVSESGRTPTATAPITVQVKARFGILLEFLQSPTCRFFSRCSVPVPIFQRDLVALCGKRVEIQPILRELQRLNAANRKFESFKALNRNMRRVLKQQSVYQLLGNGGDDAELFEDFDLYLQQFDSTHSWQSPLLTPPRSMISQTPITPPTPDECGTILDAAEGSLSNLAAIFQGFILGSHLEPVRIHFRSFNELAQTIKLVIAGEPLGDIGTERSAIRHAAVNS